MIIKDDVVTFFKSSFLLKIYTEIFPYKMKLCVCVCIYGQVQTQCNTMLFFLQKKQLQKLYLQLFECNICALVINLQYQWLAKTKDFIVLLHG